MIRLDLKTTGAVVIFVFVLIAYTVQSELASIVQRTYTKPYFLLYVGHSGFVIIFPLHILALRLLGIPIHPLFQELRERLREQLLTSARSKRIPLSRTKSSLSIGVPFPPAFQGDGEDAFAEDEEEGAISRSRTIRSETGEEEIELEEPLNRWRRFRRGIGGKRFPWKRLGRLCVYLTVMLAVPAGSWYSAVPLTSMTDITAIYNSNAFFAYLFSIYLLGSERWEVKKVLAVSLACIGVGVIAYGDTSPKRDDDGKGWVLSLVGNMLALFGSVSYGFYEVWYKKYAALPEPGDEGIGNRVGRSRSGSAAGLLGHSEVGYTGLATSEDEVTTEREDDRARVQASDLDDGKPSLPELRKEETSPALFLLHANLLTSLIGLFTICMLWVPIPLLHWTGLEVFEVPPADVRLMIAGIVSMGVLFNGAFMILLGLWGPVVASVGNLCTLVLVAIADTLLRPDHALPSLAAIIGSTMIVSAFAVLVVGMLAESSGSSDLKAGDIDA